MIYGIVYEWHGPGEGFGEPKGLYGPFSSEEDAETFKNAMRSRLSRIHKIGEYSEFRFMITEAVPNLDFEDEVRVGDKVITAVGDHAVVDIINKELNSALISYNRTRNKDIVPLNTLQIIYA